MANKGLIAAYIGEFRGQAAFVASLKGDPSSTVGASDPQIRVALHKKVLYVAMLESLASTLFCQKGANSKRFLNLLEEHSGWKHGKFVSIPLLWLCLKNSESENRVMGSPLGRECEAIIYRHDPLSPGCTQITDIDREYETLAKLAESEEGKKNLNEHTHFQLLWKYRNYLAHEFCAPGRGMEMPDDSQPYYHGWACPARLDDPDTRELIRKDLAEASSWADLNERLRGRELALRPWEGKLKIANGFESEEVAALDPTTSHCSLKARFRQSYSDYFEDVRRSHPDQTRALLEPEFARLELVYPVTFFRRLVDGCIDSLETYYTQHDIDLRKRFPDRLGWQHR